MTSALTAEYVREILRYDPATGEWTWLVALTNSVRIGDRAGYVMAAAKASFGEFARASQ